MPWTDSGNHRLPADWKARRSRILHRDPRCTLRTDCAGAPSTEVDHIGSPTDHGYGNLRGVCRACHRRRTQGQAARAAGKLRRRTPEPHPYRRKG